MKKKINTLTVNGNTYTFVPKHDSIYSICKNDVDTDYLLFFKQIDKFNPTPSFCFGKIKYFPNHIIPMPTGIATPVEIEPIRVKSDAITIELMRSVISKLKI